MNKELARGTLILAIIVTIIAITTILITLILSNSNTPLSNSLSSIAVIITIISLVIASSQIFLASNNHVTLQGLLIILQKRKVFFFISTIILIITMLSAYILIIYNRQPTSAANACSSASSPFGIGVAQAPNGDCIGISDGNFAFDTHRLDGNLKSQAATKLRVGDTNGAISLLYQAVEKDPNDAEALIYLENQRVLRSGAPYITFVVGTTLAGSTVGNGRDMLQGAYIAQKEYNSSCILINCIRIRILIANTGNIATYATPVAQQIIQIAQKDKTFVGVMGWPSSLSSLYAIHELAAAHIPMVSPTASSDLLTNISPYFFRVVPPDVRQGSAGANYAHNKLHAARVVVFVDHVNSYSQTLASAFEQQFATITNDPKSIVKEEEYTVYQPQTAIDHLNDALNQHPDLIYFAGYADDANALIKHLPTSGPFAHLLVLGGDALYQLKNYSSFAAINRLYFTAFAYPDEWAFQAMVSPPFFAMYANAFDPNGMHTGNYGYTRPTSGAMLSYDAMQALLRGSENALSKKGQDFTSFTPGDLKQALDTVKFQGVTGQITFGPDGNPVNKAIVILYVNSGGFIQIQSIEGQFLAR